MASRKQEDLDLLDVVLYAPIGFVYEYRKVLPQLVKKGRSQVQLGMFLGRMAASKGGAGAERATADALTTLATVAARGITEFGQAVGLAPPEDDAPPINVVDVEEVPPPTPAKKQPKKKAAAKKKSTTSGPRLPIAGYDDLTAREIVALLDDLTPAQRARLRDHESSNRNRKTVLAKLDGLES
jgi:hypothetical protein